MIGQRGPAIYGSVVQKEMGQIPKLWKSLKINIGRTEMEVIQQRQATQWSEIEISQIHVRKPEGC